MENLKENYWTPERVSEFRQELSESIKKETSNAKHCFKIAIILLALAFVVFVKFGISLFGIISAGIILVACGVCIYFIFKYRTNVRISKVMMEMPFESY